MTSPESSEPSSALTLLDAPAMAPLEARPTLRRAPTEAVERRGANSDHNVDTTRVAELGATAPMDGAASGEPMAPHFEPNMVESV
jgi:hypothetical protein